MTIAVRQSWILLVALMCAYWSAYGQRKPKPGFNLFSKEQDVQLGKEGAAEIEKKVTLVDHRELNEYIQRIGRKLSAQPEADEYPYTFKLVHDENINAFALPGGPTYVHTGLILAAENEAQLAGVMAHEIAHVALRHGTNQASKANVIQLAAMLGGSLLGGGSLSGQLAKLGIGFGANSVLLKFSRGAERNADILGAYIMSGAGYNPIEMARFFEKLEAETGSRSAVEQFFSSHPNPGNRTERVEEEIRYMPKRNYNADTGQLPKMKVVLKGLPPPKASREPARPVKKPEPPITEPSARPRRFEGRGFTLAYPGNWELRGDRNSTSVTFAPRGGIVPTSGGKSAVGYGVLAGFYAPERRRRVELRRDTEQLVSQLLSADPSVRLARRRSRELDVDGQPALLTTLYSDSPHNGEREVDQLLTVARPQGLYYMVFVAPQREFRQYQPTFEEILRSVRF